MWICARSSRSGHVACRGSSEASCRSRGRRGRVAPSTVGLIPTALVRPREPSPPSSTLWLTPLPIFIAAARQGDGLVLPHRRHCLHRLGPPPRGRSVRSSRSGDRVGDRRRVDSLSSSRSRSSCASPCRWRSHPDPDPAGRSRGEVRGLGHPPPVHDVYEGHATLSGTSGQASISPSSLAPATRSWGDHGHPLHRDPERCVYRFVPHNELAGFPVFAWLAFWELCRSPEPFDGRSPTCTPGATTVGPFLPSLVFWPSSLGKEAWMIFVLGGATYGLARLFRGAWWVSSGWGWAHGAGGGAPHLALIFLGSAGVAWLFRPSGRTAWVWPRSSSWRVRPPPRRLAGRGRSGGGLLRHRASGPGKAPRSCSTKPRRRAAKEDPSSRTSAVVDRRLPLGNGHNPVPALPLGGIGHRPAPHRPRGGGAPGAHHPRPPRADPASARGVPRALPHVCVGVHDRVHHRILERGELRDPRPPADPALPHLPRAPVDEAQRTAARASAPVAEQVGEHAHRPSGVNGSDRSERAIHSAASACDPPRRSARAILSPSWHRPAGSPPPRLRTCRRAGGGRRGPAAVTGSEVAERMARVSRPFRVP